MLVQKWWVRTQYWAMACSMVGHNSALPPYKYLAENLSSRSLRPIWAKGTEAPLNYTTWQDVSYQLYIFTEIEEIIRCDKAGLAPGEEPLLCNKRVIRSRNRRNRSRTIGVEWGRKSLSSNNWLNHLPLNHCTCRTTGSCDSLNEVHALSYWEVYHVQSSSKFTIHDLSFQSFMLSFWFGACLTIYTCTQMCGVERKQ